MRAARLIRLVLLLQNRRAMTAAELAAELEVSRRTVVRDVAALSEAGVPVYADRGRAGGYRLIGGYRTRLTGLGRDEAEALFLSGVPTALRDLGLADAASAAELKVLAALDPHLGDARRGVAQRFHLDAPGWWQEPTAPGLLPRLADALWDDRRVTVRYRRRDATVARTLEPYGLVLKAGVWYLAARVAAPDAEPAGEGGGEASGEAAFRVYRVDRLVSVAVREERFGRAEDFELPAFWARRAAAFARSLLREEVVVRLTETGARRLRSVHSDRAAAAEALAAGERTERGGRNVVTVRLPVESLDVAFGELFALGPEVEVLAPDVLRERFAEAARRTAALYTDVRRAGP
ncbi:WYL domain-containing protein [Streptomyces chumphonensis]|uniref:WYL domain-containing protein n=1 Tax=Streptomyces chumphonensis TaxID=1214925 RepID=A0A927EX99_9ACTN|nr:WYL domain-containing protein [Streptomyces chumphonensis]MBD3930349.1 WYL domain-containing protein [Streptomyces chumphonensis]